jgi:hypothetical protein
VALVCHRRVSIRVDKALRFNLNKIDLALLQDKQETAKNLQSIIVGSRHSYVVWCQCMSGFSFSVGFLVSNFYGELAGTLKRWVQTPCFFPSRLKSVLSCKKIVPSAICRRVPSHSGPSKNTPTITREFIFNRRKIAPNSEHSVIVSLREIQSVK